MKIVYVTASLPYGPGEAFIIPEVKELRRRGHDVLMVPRSPRSSIVHNDARSMQDITLREPLLSGRIVVVACSSLYGCSRDAWQALRVLCRSRNLRVFLKNLAVYPKGLWLARVCSQWGADHIHSHWASTTATMALVASMVSGIPWSLTAHRWDITEQNLLKAKVEHASFIRTISEQGAVKLSALANCSRERIRVIHVGIDLPDVACHVQRHTDTLHRNKFRVVVPANLLEVKGHRFLFDAIRLLRARGFNILVDMAGDGPLRDELSQFAQTLGIAEYVDFLGVVPHDDLLRRMEQGEWDLCVLPSIITADGAEEGIPVSLMEAMSYQIPVISTKSGCIPELLYDGAGVLVPPGNSQALTEAIVKLMSDPGFRRVVAEKGRRRVEQHFAIEAVVDDLLGSMSAGESAV